MTVVALTNKQRNAIADVVTVGFIQSVGGGIGDETRALSFLANAEAVTKDIQLVKQDVTRHDLAYSVVHDVGEALLAAYGYRTSGDDRHQSVIVFLAAMFQSPPADQAALRSDVAREKRNSRYYKAYQPSHSEAEQLVADADILLKAAQGRFS